jgi:hypothetical protein
VLSKKAIKDFQKIYLQEYGQKIPYSKAKHLAQNFLKLFSTIYKPIPTQP